MNHDLKTEEGRKAAVADLNQAFINEMRAAGIELAENAECDVTNKSIFIYIPGCFASEVYFNGSSIDYGSSGSFNPKTEGPYWRTIHAASILKNWNAASELTTKFCNLYKDLVTEILETNETNKK